MLSKNISYHTRLISDNSVKVCGGSFGGNIDIETVDRLVKSHFSVSIKPSGRPVFVDKHGREVSLYLSVDPANTLIGKTTMKTWYSEQSRINREREKRDSELSDELDELISSIGSEQVIEILKRSTK